MIVRHLKVPPSEVHSLRQWFLPGTFEEAPPPTTLEDQRTRLRPALQIHVLCCGIFPHLNICLDEIDSVGKHRLKRATDGFQAPSCVKWNPHVAILS